MLVMAETTKQVRVSINTADLLDNMERFKEIQTGFGFFDELWGVLYIFWLLTP